MFKFKERLESIKDNVLNEVFPDLSGMHFLIGVVNNSDSMIIQGVLGYSYYFDVDKIMKKASDSAIYGCFAHEMAHIFIDSTLSPIKNIYDTFACNLGRKYTCKTEKLYSFEKLVNNTLYKQFQPYYSKVEREADLLVLKRGAGEQLLDLVKFQNKHFKNYTSTVGLSEKELVDLLNISF